SVTERCNFRCTYCLPGGCPAAAGAPPLSVEEIDRLVGAFAVLGFWKVRITGGEPTLRGDVVEIVRRVAATPGVRHVGMTTNGYRLRSIAGDLARAGLTCLNVSVDSLDPERFAAITGTPLLPRVLEGVEAAMAAGIPRLKVNAVLLAGTDGAEVDRFLAWTREAPVTVRFIELMEVGADPAWFARNHVPAAELERLLQDRGWSRLPRGEGEGPATNYGKAGHPGRVGIIAPSRHDACARCNRLRVSSGGRLRLCLFDRREVPLRPLLGSDAQRGALTGAIRAAVGAKPASHPVARGGARALSSLSAIGG
ncbi:MAG TPA: GTP 3',8-cyclase MoaA, partial [Anaeromyxobacter sp.]|nr:GTP 3',8-cyclase MoaA [Anaeromyxobacter sp.]